jgi:hypothetical protein
MGLAGLWTAYTMCCPREERGFFRELFRPVEGTGLDTA